jgi:hypothetical protein
VFVALRASDGDNRDVSARDTTASLFGHPEMIAHGKAILHRHGWDKEALKEESYFVPAPVHA